MEKIKEVLIVEGKYDKNTISQVVDCTVIETSGFGVFNDRQKTALIRKLAETRGIVVMTDSDSAGFLIRNHIKGIVNSNNIKHAYIPDIYGKEKRKTVSSKEGKIGVEGMPPEIILNALRKAGATFLNGDSGNDIQSEKITKADFYELGLSGKPDSSKLRAALLSALDFPERMSANALLEIINSLFSKSDFIETVNSIKHGL